MVETMLPCVPPMLYGSIKTSKVVPIMARRMAGRNGTNRWNVVPALGSSPCGHPSSSSDMISRGLSTVELRYAAGWDLKC
jgi:hypothetical protein